METLNKPSREVFNHHLTHHIYGSLYENAMKCDFGSLESFGGKIPSTIRTYHDTHRIACIVDGSFTPDALYWDSTEKVPSNAQIFAYLNAYHYLRSLNPNEPIRAKHFLRAQEIFVSTAIDGKHLKKLRKEKKPPITIHGKELEFMDPLEIPNHLENIFNRYNEYRCSVTTSIEGCIRNIALVYHRLVILAPFTVANGRMTRLITSFLLMLDGFPLMVDLSRVKALLAQATYAVMIREDATLLYTRCAIQQACEETLKDVPLVQRKGDPVEGGAKPK